MRWLAVALITAAMAGPLRAETRYGEAQVQRLTEIAQSEKEPESRRALACRELAKTDLRTQVPLLHRLLREERSVDIRVAAACTLTALGDKKSPKDLLLATAYDGTRTPSCTRGDILLALCRTGDPAAEVSLERVLKTDLPTDEPDLYADACRALLVLNTPGSRRLLFNALRDGSPAVRFATITPLSTLALNTASPDRLMAREVLRQAAERDPDEKAGAQAMSALLWTGVDGATYFKLLQQSPQASVRIRAARVLDRQYLSAARLKRVRAALAAEKDPDVHAAIEAALKRQKPE